jgi:hypothetical protein
MLIHSPKLAAAVDVALKQQFEVEHINFATLKDLGGECGFHLV